jgi:hypothetical protein
MTDLHRRSLRLFGGTLLVYALLVATHLGEFWPFSIYPMFSQAGNPWSRAVVRSVPDVPRDASWDTLTVEALPGEPFALEDHDVDNIDLANYVSKTETWNASRRSALQRLFREDLDEHRLLIMRVNGRLQPDGAVTVRYVPYLYVGADTTALNPALRPPTDRAPSASR